MWAQRLVGNRGLFKYIAANSGAKQLLSLCCKLHNVHLPSEVTAVPVQRFVAAKDTCWTVTSTFTRLYTSCVSL